MIISPWPEIRSRSHSRWSSTSPPPSPETVTSVSPTVSCSRANVRPPQRASPALRLLILHRATPQDPTHPHLSTWGLVLPHLQVQCADRILSRAIMILMSITKELHQIQYDKVYMSSNLFSKGLN